MKIDVRLSGDDLAHLAFVAEPSSRGDQYRLMAIEGHLDVMAFDTLAALLDGAQQFLATVSAEIDRVAIIGNAADEMERHNAHPCAADTDHTDVDVELLIDASAVRASKRADR